MLHQINDLYCINLSEVNNVAEQQEKSLKSINHIVIIDNSRIPNKSYLDEIINLYPKILSEYNKIANLKSIYLIITHPKLKCIQIDMNNIYTEFRKILYSLTSIEFIDIFNLCITKIDEESINEIVVFTESSRKPTRDILDILNTLNNHILSIVTSSYITLDEFIIYKLTSKQEYEDFINSKIFLHTQDNRKPNLINTKETNIFGTNTNIIHTNYNFVPISNKIDSIAINETEYPLILQETSLTEENILEMISCVLYDVKNLNQTILTFKNILLNIVVNNNEFRNRIMSIYYKYKCIFSETIANTINNLNDEHDENMQIMIEYSKKTTLSHDKSFIIPDIKIINIDNFTKIYDTNTTKQFNDSLELFESSITLSNWYDEIKNNCALGILFTFESANLTKKGVHGFGTIGKITSMFMSVTDFIGNAKEYFSHNRMDYGNLNDAEIVKDGIIGSANAILPIYIHKMHWKIAKLYLKPILGMIQSHSPFSYVKAHENIYYSVFAHMTKLLFNSDKEFLNNKFVQVYFSFFRTCAEICFENGYHFGIKNLMNMYMNNNINRISKSYLDYDKLFAQTLTTGYNITNIETFLQYLLEERIRLCVKYKKYDNNYFNVLIEMLDDEEKLDAEFDSIINSVCDIINYDMQAFAAFYKINKIFREMISMTSTYGQFIKRLDKNYGILEHDLTEFVIKNIVPTNNNISFEDFYNIIQVPYNKNVIIMYILQGIYNVKNKNMRKHINDGIYVDILNTEITNDYIKNYIK